MFSDTQSGNLHDSLRRVRHFSYVWKLRYVRSFEDQIHKHLKRTGWVRRDVRDPECVAGHMYRMAVLSMLLTDQDGVDKNKCIKMALVHDMAESIVGDITPNCGVSSEDKHQQEMSAMEVMCSMIGGDIGKELVSLFMEYEEQNTPESRLVKDLDRFDMILQAFEYETDEDSPGRLQEFFDSTKGVLQHSRVRGWTEELLSQRDEVGGLLETREAGDGEEEGT